ncbi:hypothetical protein HWV62_1072 [Athelia sp. TMB]|nr:hypothetical protein HWV62_1072 [Athelia sp. TMB]
MPIIFRGHRGRLVNANGRQVTTELSVLMATAMALGVYRSDVDQEVHADTPDGPVWTRTSVTFDFSDGWRAGDSPWTPPSGMSLDEAVGLLMRGIGPLRVLENPIIQSPAPTRTPSPDSDAESAVSSSSGSLLLRSPFPTHISRDDAICEVCLTKCVIASPDDCDCVETAAAAAAHPPVLPADSFNPDANLAYSLEARSVASNSRDITLSHDVALAQYLETRGVMRE